MQDEPEAPDEPNAPDEADETLDQHRQVSADVEARLYSVYFGVGESERAKAIDDLCAAHPGDEEAIRDLAAKFAGGELALGSLDQVSRAMPDHIGPYKVLKELGSGGMGVVYLAELRKPVHRRVALKVIKLGMDSKAVLARFGAERQALALMNHDNIARVFDAGTTERGQPYFAMEHVPGLPITEYCDKQRLNTRERLGLFVQVCEGVQHAHQKGVIHRDLKPGNILVTEDQGKPVAKIIDFGLARATDHRLVAQTVFTEQGHVIGTPEYMSPEQAEMSSADIDTRTDVYSLGVVLYELLVGELPFSSLELRDAGFAEIQRKIREDQPRKPSTRLSELGDATSEIATQRGTTVPSLMKEVRGDLDWIVMMALEKNRNRRYATPIGLAEDVERCLRHEPVLASPPSLGYRLKKFVRRNRIQVLSAGAVAAAVIVGAVGTGIGFLRADKALSEFDLLSNVVKLVDAKSSEAELYPAVPAKAAEMRTWLAEQGEPLVEQVLKVQEVLANLRQQADVPPDPITGGYEFEDLSKQFLHDALDGLVVDLEAFSDATTGEVAAVRDRLAWAEKIQELSLGAHEARWEEAIAAIEVSRKYSGLILKEQLGLVPLGPDPLSELWEFVDLRSGKEGSAIPERDSSSGQLLITEDTGIVLVLIPGATFTMGAQAQDSEKPGYDAYAQEFEGPPHEVTLDDYFIAKHELTQAQWRRLSRGEVPSVYPAGFLEDEPDQRVSWKNPVENVSWFSSDTVLRRHMMTLPTEAQWECAARGGTLTPWWTGTERESLRGAVNLADATAGKSGAPWPTIDDWPGFEDGYTVHAPADTLRPNPFGLHHMTGNVWEWCQDRFTGYGIPPRDGDGLRGNDDIEQRVMRGGAFTFIALGSRAAYRNSTAPGSQLYFVGLRAARKVVE